MPQYYLCGVLKSQKGKGSCWVNIAQWMLLNSFDSTAGRTVFWIEPSNQYVSDPHSTIQNNNWERSGRVLDSRPRGRGLEPHRRHYVVFLSKDINPGLELVQPRKIRPFIIERLLMGRKESNQTNKQIRNINSITTSNQI